MRVLIFHGYLLHGTGSNIYTANVARALARQGNEVHLLCQERHPEELDFVDAVADWESGKLTVRRLREPRAKGGCTVYRPSIGQILPVYVADEYEGFRALAFPDLSDAQLDHYVTANVEAVGEVAARTAPDVAIANHLVMGPTILARALEGRIPYAAKIHGSALEYTVRPNPRFLPYAREGVAGATAVIVGSGHTARSLWEVVADPGLPARTTLGPPGVDVEDFAPRIPAATAHGLADLRDRLAARDRGGFNRKAKQSLEVLVSDGHRPTVAELSRVRSLYDPTGVDEDAPQRVAELHPARQRIVAFVGKLIVSKGIDLLLAAWPLVLERVPEARLVVVGFGNYREGAELLARSLAAGDLQTARWIAEQGRVLEGGPPGALTALTAFLRSPQASGEAYARAARGLARSLLFTGRLDHAELAELLPACECLAVPSTFPEAFGMVAIEAAACGVWPVVANHSGLAEVASSLGGGLSPAHAALLTFDNDDRAVDQLAGRITDYLLMSPGERSKLSDVLRATVVERYGWDGVARHLVEAAGGEFTPIRR